uniref:Uncharacterized protein n=1 Tax=Heterorhabditis bacteriophora TaxID=37862 RepID=A0A1I7WSV7_HETBA
MVLHRLYDGTRENIQMKDDTPVSNAELDSISVSHIKSTCATMMALDPINVLYAGRASYREPYVNAINNNMKESQKKGNNEITCSTQQNWEVPPHAANSPDLAPSDYHLFRLM